LVANVKEKTMGQMRACKECGRTYDISESRAPNRVIYCSAGCERKARAAQGSSSNGGASPISRSTVVNLKDNIGGIKLAIPIIVIMIIIGLIGLAVNGIRNAFSDIKIDVVSASCETQEKFVSILKEAGVSGTVIEGEEFTTYSQQALDAVKERNSLFKDSVYFVRLPDSVNAYIWFKTEDQIRAYVYKTK
jgi:hypothetical protein